MRFCPETACIVTASPAQPRQEPGHDVSEPARPEAPGPALEVMHLEPRPQSASHQTGTTRKRLATEKRLSTRLKRSHRVVMITAAFVAVTGLVAGLVAGGSFTGDSADATED